MKKILLLSIALFFVSCGHMGKGKSCHSKGSHECKMENKKCDKKECKSMHKKKGDHKAHADMSAAECDLNSCKVHRTPKTKM